MTDRGLLLVNLGSPLTTAVSDVRRYLNEFLTDPYVIDLPAVVRQPLVRGLITPFRAPKSAEAYRQIWTKEGSPLVVYTRQFASKLARELHGEFDVRWAMRYAQPSIASVVADWPVREVVVVPMYPHYADSSTRTAIEEAALRLGSKRRGVLEDFFVAEAYIDNFAAAIEEHARAFRPEALLFSFHGLPEHHMTKKYPLHCLKTADCCARVTEVNRHCYRAQCFATAEALRKKVSIDPGKTEISFQSRLGRRPWIRPYTDVVVTEMAKRGVKRLAVACPSFVTDCLETLEEVQIRLREQFIEAGGEDLSLVPGLNAREQWVKDFAGMIRQQFPRAQA